MIHDTTPERHHVRREATITGEQRDRLLIVEALAVAAVDVGLLPHSLTKEEMTRALEDLREVVRRWDRNVATHEVWDEAEGHWVNPGTEVIELGRPVLGT
jgi:hypothetical protein